MNPLGDDEDPWPDEPEEFDPDSLGPETPDPASNVEPDLESAIEATADVDDDLFRAFWGAVVFLNVALAALALGAMLVYFRGDWTNGGAALLVGAVAALFTVRHYRHGKRAAADGGRGSDNRDATPDAATGAGTDRDSDATHGDDREDDG